MYVHRDPTVTLLRRVHSDFEMGNPIIPDPLNPGDSLYSVGGSRVLADPNPAHKQFLIMDTRVDDTQASGIWTAAGSDQQLRSRPRRVLQAL